jgi:hypothetical protein
MKGSLPRVFEMRRKLKEALEKIIASDFRVSIDGHKKGAVVVAIGRTRKPGSALPDEPEAWYRELGERIAVRDKASFLAGIDNEGGLVYDGFIWDMDFPADCDTSRYVAAVRDFMAGVGAGRAIDADQAVNAARLKAAEAAILPDNKSARGDRDDSL